jgi:phosphoglycerate dehydrogenase-like enzyme
VRKLPYAFEAARRGAWRDIEERFRGIELSGKILGVIGYGRIGGNLSRYATAMGMQVVAFDPNVAQMPDATRRVASSQQVLRLADVVAICVHLDETTRGMVSEDWFNEMKPGAYFLNTSRGEVVEEEAMLRALETGKLAAAAVDVITGEQSASISDHPVIRYARSHENLIVTPHMAGLTVDSEMKAGTYAFDALRRHLNEILEPSA